MATFRPNFLVSVSITASFLMLSCKGYDAESPILKKKNLTENANPGVPSTDGKTPDATNTTVDPNNPDSGTQTGPVDGAQDPELKKAGSVYISPLDTGTVALPAGKELFATVSGVPAKEFLLQSNFLPVCLNLNEKFRTTASCLGLNTQKLILGPDVYGFRDLRLSNGSACLDVEQYGTADGTPVYKNGCNNNNAQRFKYEALSDGSYRFHSELNVNKCLQLSKTSKVAAVQLELSTCVDEIQQKFTFLDVTPKKDVTVGQKMMQAQHSGLCLEVDADASGEVTAIQQNSCRESPNQILEFKDVGSEQVEIRTISGGCLGSDQSTLADDDDLMQVECKDAATQRWTYSGTKDTGFEFHSAANANLCLEVNTAMPKSRALIRAAKCSGAAQQKFKVFIKESNFVNTAALIPTVEDKCYIRMKIDLSAASAADSKAMQEGLGPVFLDELHKRTNLVCAQLYGDQKDFTPIRFLRVIADPKMGGAYVSGHKYGKLMAIGSEFIGNTLKNDKNGKIVYSGLVVHELTHVYQKSPTSSDGSDKGLIEGMADTVRMYEGLSDPNWPTRDKSGPWNKGYERTGMFLMFVDQKVPGFKRKLNQALGGAWTKDTFKSLSGKSPDEWWAMYIADASCNSTNYICGK